MVNRVKGSLQGQLRPQDRLRILGSGWVQSVSSADGYRKMYRVFAIACGVLALAGCSSLNLDALKPAPPMDTVRFESDPPGAEARVSNGQTCRTPCALALPANATYNVTFTLNGYQPGAETLEVASIGDNTMQLRPNPVVVQLAPAAPPPKPRKAIRKRPAAKPKPKVPKQAAPPAPKPAAPPAAAAPPPPPPPAQAQPSPWPPAQR